jgi:hypothetical protein
VSQEGLTFTELDGCVADSNCSVFLASLRDKDVKLSLSQAVKVLRVVRHRDAHIFSR